MDTRTGEIHELSERILQRDGSIRTDGAPELDLLEQEKRAMAAAAEGHLVPVGPEVVRKIGLGERELARRKRRRDQAKRSRRSNR